MQNIGVSKRQINRQLKQIKETYKNLQVQKDLRIKTLTISQIIYWN